MDDMNVKLWSRLPSEILEQTLSFLSVPVLCRFRTVCKRWSSLICEPAFGALCVQHARQDACFLVARYAIRHEADIEGHDNGLFGENHGWSFLDLDARRWYTIKHDERDVFDCFKYGSVAMDGGLVCQLLDADADEEEDSVLSVFVSNPIAKTSDRLLSAPYPCYYGCSGGLYRETAVMNMVVDNIALTYKIFLMPSGVDFEVPPPMAVYESTTNGWRSMTNLPKGPFGEEYSCVRCSTFFNGLLYILMCRNVERGASEYWLWSYNHVEDAWKDTCVDICLTELNNPQLIVSDNRLFLASWLRKKFACRLSRWSYEVSEVLLEDQSRRRVFQFPENKVAKVFDILHQKLYESLHAFGFRESIILMCKSSGVSKMYYLSTSSWALLPRNPLVPQEGRCWVDHGCWLDYGKPMNLILPMSTP